MAGGVTSGIIYPGAVAEIAKSYSFHSIGGTSVGAIAAIGAAAAEYRRRTEQDPGRKSEGFDLLARLHKELVASGGEGRSRLFHLFTPERGENGTPDTRGLFALFAALTTGGGARERAASVIRVAMVQPSVAWSILLLGGVGLYALIRLSLMEQIGFGVLALLGCGALALCAGAAAFARLVLRRWLPAFRRNNYGICTGKTDPDFHGAKDGAQPFEGLTPWIHRIVQTAAARSVDGPPLTFGDLWNAPAPDGSAKSPATDRSIELAMITSDISRNRAAQLPFIEWPSPLYFCEATLRRYFPDAVVRWMKEHKGEARPDVIVPDGVHRLPPPEQLPVVLAARLSLSFPVLLSAVPLWTPDFSKGDAENRFPLRRAHARRRPDPEDPRRTPGDHSCPARLAGENRGGDRRGRVDNGLGARRPRR
jgi:hypothetical protein